MGWTNSWGLDFNMIYVIKHIPKNSLKFGPTYNSNFIEDLVLSIKDQAEYLSDEINIPSISFRSDYLRNRNATLIWKYGTDKFKAGYVRDNDDPTRPKSGYTTPAEGGMINVE
ncbi:hypothetical protein H5410_043348 [Solanum commersonii]|uniref:Uncharacterized protein n=1 Tax=Solanum commersonii TaxID=4109 RepID=A0A9J5XYK9_SOLCO|nr:hypothetical protein H5410_043348 [Solanum commersonii]